MVTCTRRSNLGDNSTYYLECTLHYAILKQHDENLFTTLKTSRKLVPTLLRVKSDIFHSAYLTYADILEILALHVARNAPLRSKRFFCCFGKRFWDSSHPFDVVSDNCSMAANTNSEMFYLPYRPYNAKTTNVLFLWRFNWTDQ